MAKRIDEASGVAAASAIALAFAGTSYRDSGSDSAVLEAALATVPQEQVATAVRFLLQRLAERAPGRSVEVRVPPWGAVQFVPGVNHGRGTPPNVVEASPAVFLALALGRIDWQGALSHGGLTASGASSNIAEYFPLREG